MGICTSQTLSDQERRDRATEKKSNTGVDQKMRQRKRREDSTHKLLLLGAGESGKSTLFKQMVFIYGDRHEQEMNEETRAGYKEFVYSNLITNAQSLAAASETFGPVETEAGLAAKVFCEDESLETDESLSLVLSEQVVKHLKDLWSDPGIQKTYAQRSNFNLNDSTAYFFDLLDTISSPNYVPSIDDILRVRIRTTGIVEHKFTIDGVKFRMYDVGGQRNERKKWIHCFAEVQAVLFVAALSEFDQVLYEEQNTNRMTEALDLFRDIANSEHFVKSSIILFLNKIDLFQQKIATKNITDSACPELRTFTGNCRDSHQTSEFIKRIFLNKYHGTNEVFTHITCATNTDTVRAIFNDVKSIIIRIAMQEGGILDM